MPISIYLEINKQTYAPLNCQRVKLVSWCDCLDSQVAHPRLWAQGASLCVWFFWILVSVVFGCGCWGFCFIGRSGGSPIYHNTIKNTIGY